MPAPSPPQTSARSWYDEPPSAHVSNAAASQAQAIADRLAAQNVGQGALSIMLPTSHQQTGLWQPGASTAPQPMSTAAAAAQAIADRLAAQAPAGAVAGGLPHNGNTAGHVACAVSYLPSEADKSFKRKKWDSQ